jgi:protein-L-isoaspartate(D-aspartate) O-methyltransferase
MRYQLFNNDDLVNHLKNRLYLSPNVEKVLRKNDRGNYCGGNCRNDIYDDSPYLLDRRIMQTMSAPHIHATAIEKMNIYLQSFLNKVDNNYSKLKFNVLDIGCGSGYVTACMADLIHIGQNDSKVVGIDIYSSLVKLTHKNLKKYPRHSKQLNRKNIIIKCQNGWNGFISEAPYHFIHVGAMADNIPKTLFNQLIIGGGMLIPINSKYCLITKTGNKTMKIDHLYGVRFVEFIHQETIRNKKQSYPQSTDKCIINE